MTATKLDHLGRETKKMLLLFVELIPLKVVQFVIVPIGVVVAVSRVSVFVAHEHHRRSLRRHELSYLNK